MAVHYMMFKEIVIRVCKRIPANSLWDRIVLSRKIEQAAKLLAHNQKNTNDQIHVQDPHSA